MRSLIIALIVFGSLPIILNKPYVGAIMWAWVSYMNPHRMTYGFAYDFPFAAVIAGTTMIAYFISNEKYRLPMNGLSIMWLLWIFWLIFVMLFPALDPEAAAVAFKQTMKIQIMAILTTMMITDRKRLHHFIWIIVLSLGFFGIKGGLFAIATGGNFRVWGPPDSYVEGNNELALALLMIMPLMWYLRTTMTNKRHRQLMAGALVLVLFAVIASFSRGAFASLIIITFMFILKSKNKIPLLIGAIVLAGVFAAFVPDSWSNRMKTIDSAEKDESFMGRVDAWNVAIAIANDRPLTGGGFRPTNREVFYRYSPNPNASYHSVHSIYFEVLGDQGYIGLMIFLGLFITAWFFAGRIIRDVRDREDLRWAGELAAMIQVGMTAYGSGGALLGLAYYDLPYSLISMLIMVRAIIDPQLKLPPPSEDGSSVMPDKNATGKIVQYGVTLGEIRQRNQQR